MSAKVDKVDKDPPPPPAGKPPGNPPGKPPGVPGKPMDESGQRLVEVKVGAFVLLTLVAAIAIVLVLAQKKHVFEHRVVIHTVFQEVEGLREGAPVRLSGVNIGTVSRIAFAKEKRASSIQVDLEISRASLARIGTDSVARIGTQGLLGDKIIELSVSESATDALEPGATINSQEPADFNKIIQQASIVLEKARVVADKAASFMEGVSDEKTLAGVRGIVVSINKILGQTEKGPGLAHSLFYDPAQAKIFEKLLTEVDGLADNVSDAVKHVDRFLGAADADGLQLVNNISRAAKNVGVVGADIHDSKIIPHVDRASGDLAKASADLSELTAYVKAGHGTVGMAIMDPTVYEQLVTVLGGVARSRVLRALVRYAITKDDGQKVGRAVDEPTPAPPRNAQ